MEMEVAKEAKAPLAPATPEPAEEPEDNEAPPAKRPRIEQAEALEEPRVPAPVPEEAEPPAALAEDEADLQTKAREEAASTGNDAADDGLDSPDDDAAWPPKVVQEEAASKGNDAADDGLDSPDEAAWPPKLVQEEKPAAKGGDGDSSDDDWGLDWSAKGSAAAAKAAMFAAFDEPDDLKDMEDGAEEEQVWEKEKPPEVLPTEAKEQYHTATAIEHNDEEDEDPDAWRYMYAPPGEEEKDDLEDDNYEYPDLVPDHGWTLWPQNSQESITATVVVQKIRARTQRVDKEAVFPSDQAGAVFSKYMSQEKKDQRAVLAALLWVEANTLEVVHVPPNLSDAAISLLKTEDATIREVVARVPESVMLTKAASKMPTKDTRRLVEPFLDELITSMHSVLGEAYGSLEAMKEMVNDVLQSAPTTVRIIAMMHIYEFSMLQKHYYGDLEGLAFALAKQCLPDRAIEITCRLTLLEAIRLADEMLRGEHTTVYRREKELSLNRLWQDWQVKPTEDDLAQIHVFTLHRQLQILLNIERDIELFWCQHVVRLAGEEERRKAMDNFLEFGKLVRPYLRDENHEKVLTSQGGRKIRVKLEDESGHKLTYLQLAKVRFSVRAVLSKLKRRYRWSPAFKTKVSIGRTNWCAQLSSLLHLALKPDCMDADEDLKLDLKRETKKRLDADVLLRFSQWSKQEEGTGVVFKPAKVVDKSVSAETHKLYRDFEPGVGKPGTGYLPMTPVPTGTGTMTPGRRPMPGTPAGAPPPTPAPGRVPGTPAGMPPPGTPGRLVVPGTPAGPPPGTPGGLRMVPGTPAGVPPSPGHARVPSTPFGAPGTPRGFARVPSTPAGYAPQSPGPGAGPGTPGTPGRAVPATPGFAAPMTPGRIPMTPTAGGVARIPATPRITPGGAAASAGRIPATPRITPGGVATGSMTPTGTGRIPQTPRIVPQTPGAIPMTPRVGAGVPQTPGGAVPFTPRPGAVPATPGGAAPFTPVPGQFGQAPFTPVPGQHGQAAPQTPMPGQGMAAPFTPTPGGMAAPFTPVVGRTHQPFTPGGPPPATPASPAPAPATPLPPMRR